MRARVQILLLVMLVLFPLLWLAGSHLRSGELTWQWFWPNALFYLAPHGVVLALCAWAPARGKPTLVMLLLLNLQLALIYGWVQWVVPGNESGLAWLLYIPGYAVCLVLYGVYLACCVAQRSRQKTG